MTRRTGARLVGAAVIIASWALTTGAQGTAEVAKSPEWLRQAMWAVGAALVVWGSQRTKVERIEIEMDKRVSKDVFEATILRIDEKLDRILAENEIKAKLDRLIEDKSR